jgi:hypothetical protein
MKRLGKPEFDENRRSNEKVFDLRIIVNKGYYYGNENNR